MDSKNFKESEFSCKCCGHYVPNVALMIILEDVREQFGKPVSINSGTRCKKHNKSVGGADNSLHVTGHAADIVVKGIMPSAVSEYLSRTSYSHLIGLGSYNSFTHVDTRGYKAGW